MASNFYVSRFISLGKVNWRLLHGWNLSFAFFDMILFTCVVSIDISAFYKYKHKGRSEAKKMAGYYLNTYCQGCQKNRKIRKKDEYYLRS